MTQCHSRLLLFLESKQLKESVSSLSSWLLQYLKHKLQFFGGAGLVQCEKGIQKDFKLFPKNQVRS